MRPHRTFRPEQRSRSGHRPSRSEHSERAQRREQRRGQPEEAVERRFGIKLQPLVAKHLSRLGVPVRLIDYRDDYARTDRVELVVLSEPDGSPIAEFQYTLRRSVRGKIADFIRAATVREGALIPRVYLEIEDKVGYALKPMADRVAHAIRDIVHGLSDLKHRFEQGNVLGMVLIIKPDGLTETLPMKLMRRIGEKARSALVELFETREHEREEREAAAMAEALAAKYAAEAEETTAAPAGTGRRDVIAPPRFFDRIRDLFRGFVPNPGLAYAFAARRGTYPLRMPFRR